MGLVAALLFLAVPANAQRNSNVVGVNLSARLDTRLTVVAGPGVVNFVLLPSGISNGSVPVTVRTIWQLPQLIGSVTTYAYFSSAPAALTNGAGLNTVVPGVRQYQRRRLSDIYRQQSVCRRQQHPGAPDIHHLLQSQRFHLRHLEFAD